MTHHVPEALSPESFEQLRLMAGLLTYALFESLPILPIAIGSRTVTIRFSKSYLAITAAGTVADSPDSYRDHGIPFSD